MKLAKIKTFVLAALMALSLIAAPSVQLAAHADPLTQAISSGSLNRSARVMTVAHASDGSDDSPPDLVGTESSMMQTVLQELLSLAPFLLGGVVAFAIFMFLWKRTKAVAKGS